MEGFINFRNDFLLVDAITIMIGRHLVRNRNFQVHLLMAREWLDLILIHQLQWKVFDNLLEVCNTRT